MIGVDVNMSEVPNGNVDQARKKKISRLIPAEEALAPIEEATERSEDSSIVSEVNNGNGKKSPYIASKEGIDPLAKDTISESIVSPPLVVVAGGTPPPDALPDSQASAQETAEKGGSQQPLAPAAPAPPPPPPPPAAATPAPQQPPNKSPKQPLKNANNHRQPSGSSTGKKVPSQQQQQPSSSRTAEKGGSPQPSTATASTSAAAPQHQLNKSQHSQTPSPSGSHHRRQSLPEQGKKAPNKEKKEPRQRQQQPKSGRPPQPSGKPPEHARGAASQQQQQQQQNSTSSPNNKKAGSESSNDTATTEKMTDAEEEEDMSTREIKLRQQQQRGWIRNNNNNKNNNSPKDTNLSDSLHNSIDSLGGAGTDDGLGGGGSGDGGSGDEDEGLFDFDDDYDDSLFQAEKEEVLTWRLDPSESLSDWTIMVKSRENDKVDTYHVHKNILAVGQRKSEYFANVFRMAGRGEVKDNVTEVEMGSAAAKVIPTFLDFMYSTDGDLDITTSTATGLRYLAQFFGVRVLHKRVMDFIQKDMSLSTCTTYYKDVCAVRDEKLLLTIAKFCSRNILKIEPKSPLVEAMDSFFLAKVMSSPLVNTKEKKYHCSVLLAKYCRKNREMIDDKQFLMLSDDKVLPLVHQSAALTLLEMEADFVVATTLSSLLEMTSLQKRCVRELSQNWRDLADETEQVTRICRKLPSSVVTDLLIRCLNQAKRKTAEDGDIDSSKHRKEKGKKDSKDSGKASSKPNPEVTLAKREFELKLEKLKQEHLDELATLKREYEVNLIRLRDMLVEKDKTVSKFWHEIKSFERLPNGHDGKMKPSGKNDEASCVPEVTKTPADGILLVTKKNGPKYPVFYYKKDDRSASESSSGR